MQQISRNRDSFTNTFLVVDYKKEDPLQVIPKMSVDILFDTAGVSLSYVSAFSLLLRGRFN